MIVTDAAAAAQLFARAQNLCAIRHSRVVAINVEPPALPRGYCENTSAQQRMSAPVRFDGSLAACPATKVKGGVAYWLPQSSDLHVRVACALRRRLLFWLLFT